MSTKELIEQEVAELPETLQREVSDFARCLRRKHADDAFNGLLLSKSALARDWSTPEADAAWANLESGRWWSCPVDGGEVERGQARRSPLKDS